MFSILELLELAITNDTDAPERERFYFFSRGVVIHSFRGTVTLFGQIDDDVFFFFSLFFLLLFASVLLFLLGG